MHPRIKETIISLMKESAYRPLTKEEIAKIFDVHKTERKMFYGLLKEMEESGDIFLNKKAQYSLGQEEGIFVGKLVMHQKGFGFVVSPTEGVNDLFISASAINGAMHEDKVVAKITVQASEAKRAEGEIIKVVERSVKNVVGTFQRSKNFGFVVADNKRFNSDIYVSKNKTMGAKNGEKVVCEITVWPKEGKNPEGTVIEVLGKAGDKGVDVLSIIREHGLPEEFPNKVLAEADNISDEVPESEMKNRMDLRAETIITIDGEDAKDLDDAVSIDRLENGNFRLGVHIADVTHYVKEGSKLDKEALKRGTSAYLIDRVIPMLPQKLSNGICSLHPNVDRLTLSIFMEIDSKGKVVNHDIAETVINSTARMTYTDVSDILENGDSELCQKYSNLIGTFEDMQCLAKILMKRRSDRGAIDFDFPEAKIILDKNGKVEDIKKYDRRIANRIIEEFMLVSNETIAEHFFWLNIPFVYRIHENPSGEKLDQFNKFLATFGYNIKGDMDEVHPKALQNVLAQVKNTKEERVINTLMLRSLKQAKYSPSSVGHFGLAAKYYSHYTSPIRRYPDLQIHRIIKEALAGEIPKKRINALQKIVEASSEQSSLRERATDLAQRDVEDLKKTEYMASKVGFVYDGIISSVTSFGMFVELDNTVEGLIRVADLSDDYYIFDQENHMLIGERTKKIYKIGEPIKIKVAKANTDLKEIDFAIVKG